MVAESDSPLLGIRATVNAMEALCTLPAVPTQDWFDLAAAALLPVGDATAAILMFARLNEDGSVASIEAVGVAGSTSGVTTTIGRTRTHTSHVELDSTHPGLAHLRGGAIPVQQLGWGPALFESKPFHAGSASSLLQQSGPPSPVTTRWAPFLPAGVLLGAVQVGPPEHRMSLLVELGLSGPEHTGSTSAPGGRDPHAQVLDALLPVLARRAQMSFGAAPQ